MRAAAIDYGRARVGLAIADDLGMLAHPRPYLDARDMEQVYLRLRAVAAEEGIGLFLVGLPRNMDGTEGPSAKLARRFAREVARRTGVRVELVDERWSTVEARQRLRSAGLDERKLRGKVDSASAALLLQSWLDAKGVQLP